jgi:hypothetical protein
MTQGGVTFKELPPAWKNVETRGPCPPLCPVCEQRQSVPVLSTAIEVLWEAKLSLSVS